MKGIGRATCVVPVLLSIFVGASASGSISYTLTLVEMRGSTMSPLISRPCASQYSAMCSGAWP